VRENRDRVALEEDRGVVTRGYLRDELDDLRAKLDAPAPGAADADAVGAGDGRGRSSKNSG
jgi:hypothetical protein